MIANDRHRCNYLHCTQPDVTVIINKEDELNARTDVSSTQHAVRYSTLYITVIMHWKAPLPFIPSSTSVNSSKVNKITIFAHHSTSMWTSLKNHISCTTYPVCRVQHITKTVVTTVVQHSNLCHMNVDRWDSRSQVVTRYSHTTRFLCGHAIHNHISCVIYPLYWVQQK